ncbi:MAG: MMPL family transporter [Spirochaetales bacterium]|nr:MMPL family transporter [Spirochaetales bacterium]
MKKKNGSAKTDFYFLAFVVFHAAVLCLFLFAVVKNKGVKLDSDLFSMMPENSSSKVYSIADENISKQSSKNIFILAENEDFKKAKNSAEHLYNELKKSAAFENLELYTDSLALSQMQEFLNKWKFNLLNENQIKVMETSPQEFCEKAVQKAYQPAVSLDFINEDPFFLNQMALENYLLAVEKSGTAMSPGDGVLRRSFEGKWYVMIKGELTEKGSALASRENAVPFIYSAAQKFETDGTRFVFSGTPFHSYASSSSASKEISVISTISLIAVAVILFFVFRSPVPILASLCSILISSGIAFCAVYSLFSNVHLLTLVFGTSLIGSSIDYSLHFFINWKNSCELKSGREVRSYLLKGLSLSLISTELCYVLLFFAPFALLKQMAVFSFSGILSSFLITTGIFPLIKIPAERKIFILGKINFNFFNRKIASKIFAAAVLCFTFISVLLFGKNFKVKNNISNLYEMEGRLKEDTILSYKVLNYSPSSWLIVTGKSEQEVLEKEMKLKEKIPDKSICTSDFIPPVSFQKKSIAENEKFLPYAEDVFYSLGFEENDVEFYKDVFAESKNSFLTLNEKFPSSIETLLQMLWIGERDETFYSIILPSEISNQDEYRQIAKLEEGVFFENKVQDISSGLDNLTKLILVMFGISYIVIFVLLKFFFTWSETFKIASIPFLSVCAICSVFAATGNSLEFFAIIGMVLVFGLGLDYIIYRISNKSSRTELFGIVLSFLTTAISFGSLALSSFVPVHIIGAAIFTGLTAAFFATML